MGKNLPSKSPLASVSKHKANLYKLFYQITLGVGILSERNRIKLFPSFISIPGRYYYSSSLEESTEIQLNKFPKTPATN